MSTPNNTKLSPAGAAGNGSTPPVSPYLGIPSALTVPYLEPYLVALLNDNERWGNERVEPVSLPYDATAGCY